MSAVVGRPSDSAEPVRLGGFGISQAMRAHPPVRATNVRFLEATLTPEHFAILKDRTRANGFNKTQQEHCIRFLSWLQDQKGMTCTEFELQSSSQKPVLFREAKTYFKNNLTKGVLEKFFDCKLR